jgi:hypothetical protein
MAAAPAPLTNVLIAQGSAWKYLDNGSDQGTAWFAPAFDDAAWNSANAQFGYGDGDEVTPLNFGPNPNNKYVTYYFRRTFFLDEDPARVQGLTLSLLRDDGAIVYLNGQEIHRAGMPPGPVNFGTYATGAGEYSLQVESLSAAGLRAGTNLMAVEIHQGSAGSSDLSFDLGLAAVSAPPTNARPSVVITAPAEGTTYGAPPRFTISADAADFDGSVTNVTFFANGNVLGSDSARPFDFEFISAPAGTYRLTAVAADNFGLTSTSAVVVVNVSTNTAPPRLLQQTPMPGRATNLSEITITFSKDVTGVDASDLLIDGVPAEKVDGAGSTFTFTIPLRPAGLANITWSASHGIADTFTPPAVFDHTAVGAAWQYELVDTAAPTIREIVPLTGLTIPALTNISVTFSEPVVGISAGDLMINSLFATGLAGSGSGPYTFTFAQPASGAVLITWTAAHGIKDLSGNDFVASSWSYNVDPIQSAVVISEIMYHPASENPKEEYVELFNRGATPVNVNGWRFSDGVDFVFPNVSIPAGGYLVVAADLTTFRAKYPLVTNVIGNWIGSLSNSREDIDLDTAAGARVDSVRYADEGDWAIRQRGNLDRGERGWRWFAEHDGLGKSAELLNPGVSNNNGQNWASSVDAEGTPGRQNSVLNSSTAPIIEEVAHSPVVPKSTEQVVVSARISGASAPNPSAVLFYRVDSLSPEPFTVVNLRDDGQGGDAAAADSLFTAVLPAQTNNTVVEFYIHVTDSMGHERSWPAPALVAADGMGPSGQVANALYQVDDSERTSTQPLYKIIMTEAERLSLERIGNNIGGSANSDAQMNATFMSIDGTSTDLHYLTGVRNRGHGTRTAKPNNFRVNFRSDQPWKGVLGLNLNAQFTWLQVLGAAIHTKSGSVGAYSRAVQVRVNNGNLVFTGGIERTYGSYAANEAIDADWADRHFPNDSGGNVYRAIRDLQPSEFDYRTLEAYPNLFGPDDKNSYTNTWFKETNVSEDDWDDLTGMLRVIGPNGTIPFSTGEVERVINVEQWLRHLALMNLLGNSETGLNSGYNDDYFMYRGINDPRFVLMYYDLDQILGFNGAFGTASSIFSAENDQGAGRALSRILRHPQFEPSYYEQLRQLIETTLSANEFNALVDQVLGDFVPLATRNQIKNWMEARRVFVSGQLPAIPPAATPIAQITAPPRSPTPRTTASFQVGGDGVTHYRYSLNGGALSPETPVTTALTLSALLNGTNTLAVIGRNSAGTYQPAQTATRVSWIVNSSWPAVRLNEVIASRSGNLRDQVEVFNEASAAVDLAGLRLSDDPSQPGKFTFSAVSLAPGAFLALDSTQLGFSFEASGEGVYLFDKTSAGGALLDSVRFGLQVADWSLGRVGESGEWRLIQPSFGQQNTAQNLGDPARVRINEWLASGQSLFPDDFIELYNPEALPVPIGGAFLTDQQAGDPMKNRVVELSFIAPRGHVAFVSGNGNSANEIDFLLPSEQGEIALLAPNLSVIDSVVYGPQFAGVSMGRCPDGNAAQKFLQFPTPGAPNECPIEPPAPQAVVLLPFDHVWKYDLSGNDFGTAWKETAFDDNSWPSGPAVLGFENAQLPELLLTPFPNSGATTYYFRTSFQVDPALAPSGIQITHLVDDGAAFYLNGQEIGSRFNLPPDATFQSAASGTVGDAGYQTFTIPPNAVRPGANVFAVEVHQSSPGSSDMVFGLSVEALIVTNSVEAAGVMINEVLANNSDLAEADGSTPDWIELYNPSTTVVDLAGMSLSDNHLVPARWVFPPGSLLPGRGFARIAFSADLPVSATNTGFGLSANGGAVFLFNNPADGGVLQSSITYGLQAANWSIGRVPDGTTNWVLTVPSLGASNITATLGNPQLLKVNEWMADPATGDDWFELFNPNPEPVNISRLLLSDSLTERAKHTLPPLSFIGAGAHGFQKFEADELLSSGTDHVGFKLSAGGEALALSTANAVLIDGVSFGPQQRGIAQGRLLDGSANIVNFPGTASPAGANYLPLASIVVNEVLNSSVPPLTDAVEFHNPTSSAVDIGGFFLSDSALNLRKYQLPSNRVIAPGGYMVIYESEFNSDAAAEPFSFNSTGDSVFLTESRNGVLTGYRASVSFGAAEPDVSIGRIPTSSGPHFVPLTSRSLGAINGTPKVGPIIISEVMYRPASTNEALEFIELHNITAAPVSLFDPASPSNTWRLRRGIEFEFPPGATIPAGGYATLVSFDPALDATARTAFDAAYGPVTRLFGPYRGRLSNSGDIFEIQKAGASQTEPGSTVAVTPFLAVDTLEYDDAQPWPPAANGTGSSLQRINLSAYGNDPVNWTAAVPNPGGPSRSAADSDGDGMPDDWEVLNGLDPQNSADATSDHDADRFTNYSEYVAGTDPRNALDFLKLSLTPAANGAVLSFQATPGRTYVVLYTDNLRGGIWETLITRTTAVPTQIEAADPAIGRPLRFYQLVVRSGN